MRKWGALSFCASCYESLIGVSLWWYGWKGEFGGSLTVQSNVLAALVVVVSSPSGAQHASMC